MSKCYIEKEAFKALLNETIYNSCGDLLQVGGLKKARDLLEVFTPADVKSVVRGEWVIEETVEIGGIWVKWCCDECGYVRTQGWKHTKDGEKPKAKYCENCGAVMRKEASDGRES